MNTVGEFRDPKYADALVREIQRLTKGDSIRIVHVCGTHEDTITQHGLRTILPPEINLVAGPGCPVCVCAAEDVDMAIELARQGHIVATFGDMIRVPSTDSSLAKERTKGADVRVIYGAAEAVEIARKNPDREVVLVGVGFETTAPTFALELLRGPPENLSILTSLKVIPPAMEILVNIEGFNVDGFITPGHVSAIIGTDAFQEFAQKNRSPCVAAGFEPLDVLEAIRMILVQIQEGRADSENEYRRVVRPEGNMAAQKALARAFVIKDAPWRGLGTIPDSGYYIREEFSEHDARVRFEYPEMESVDILPGCRCHEVILGMIEPSECSLFGKRCRPEDPYGPCMVGHEGTCRIRHENLVLH
ncbi:MAG: hydrogenase formation protein HypD [Candidatus Thorarchaeota archaeon]|nr:MAG: hydrogenase formation protein HypD [Candidatus Thorarchaeota archaeon]RLI58609.1 MAG: hydrogenase formation protein HypD [Candidatus Thorarchaeota archaeon]